MIVDELAGVLALALLVFIHGRSFVDLPNEIEEDLSSTMSERGRETVAAYLVDVDLLLG